MKKYNPTPEQRAKAKEARRGHRVVACAAMNRSGAGAHTNRRTKRQSKNTWRKEWGL